MATQRIVVVERDPDLREGIHDLLAENGKDVCSVSDCRAALATVRRGFAPDFVLIGLDPRDPHLDELAALRGETLGAHTIAMSTSRLLLDSAAARTPASLLRTHASLELPFEAHHLLALLREPSAPAVDAGVPSSDKAPSAAQDVRSSP